MSRCRLTVNADAGPYCSAIYWHRPRTLPLPALRRLAARRLGRSGRILAGTAGYRTPGPYNLPEPAQSATGEQTLAGAEHVIAIARACQTGWFWR